MRDASTPIKQETGETKSPRTLKIINKLGNPVTLVTLDKQKTQTPDVHPLRVNVKMARSLRPIYLLSFPSVLTITNILRLLSIQHSEGMESMQSTDGNSKLLKTYNLVPAMTYA